MQRRGFLGAIVPTLFMGASKKPVEVETYDDVIQVCGGSYVQHSGGPFSLLKFDKELTPKAIHIMYANDWKYSISNNTWTQSWFDLHTFAVGTLRDMVWDASTKTWKVNSIEQYPPYTVGTMET